MVMNMLKPKHELNEPVEDLCLRETPVDLLCFLNSTLEIASLAVVHHDAYVIFFDKAIMVSNDISMGQALQDFDLVV